MDPILLAITALLAIACVLLAIFWRNAMTSAAARERELQAKLSEGQTQVALGAEARTRAAALETARQEADTAARTALAARASAEASLQASQAAQADTAETLAQEQAAHRATTTALQEATAAAAAARAAQAGAETAQADTQQRLAATALELGQIRTERDTAVATVARLREIADQVTAALEAQRTAQAERQAAQDTAAAANAARAAAVTEAEGARTVAMDLSKRLDAAQAALATAQGEITALANRLASAEALRATAVAEGQAAATTVAELTQRLAQAAADAEQARAAQLRDATEIQRLRGLLTQAEAIETERQRAHEEARAQLSTQLRSLATQLYDEQGKAMLGDGRQAIEQTLTPLRDRLAELARTLTEHHSTDVRERASLQTELKNLIQAQTRLSAEAEQLGRALRADTKAQGTWGELTLERLLEASQLERGLAYELQVAVRDDEGAAGRPDAVVFLPEQKAIAIDAKVSLTAFMRATSAGSEEERATALIDHSRSVRTHMRLLADRDYPESLKGNSLDLVLLFLPSEAAFAAAVAQDPELWSDAWKKRIVIVSPTTLLATLRVVAQVWRVERQNRNATMIAKEAGGILEKLRGFLEDFDAAGKNLQQAQRAFDDARTKLSTGKGNLMNRAQKLMRYGAPAKDGTKALLVGSGDGTDAESDDEDGSGSTDLQAPPA